MIWRNDQIIGFIRRAEYAFALGKSIAYGYVSDPDSEVVSADFLKSGTYQLESMGTKYPAKYHSKTPFDPKNLRVKGIYTEPLPIDQNPPADSILDL